MEEKKLTDEEIVKDIERSTGMQSYWKAIVLDLIHRLQNDITEKDIEIERARNAINERDEWYAEQKAENERLTKENAILKGNPPLIVGRISGKTIRAKLLSFDQMKEQNAELQKQVDELKSKLDCPTDITEAVKPFVNEAVKDTAKKIFDSIFETLCTFTTKGKSEEYNEGFLSAVSEIDERLQKLAKDKGVEVE